jgi:hypothetical protein
MDTCSAETGLLKKKPCGKPSVAKCANCEMALCAQHAVAQLTPTGRKSGAYLCKECHAAHKVHDKITPAAPPPVTAKPAAAPAAAAAKPAAGAKPAAAPAGGAKPAVAAKEAPKEEKKPDDDAPLEFTPTKK